MNTKHVKISLFGKVCLIWLLFGFVYGIVLPFMWGNDPFDPLGTLSVLCENRKPFFWLWVLLDTGGITVNFYYLYNKFGGRKKPVYVTAALTLAASSLIALTLGHDITTWNPKRIAHWIATGTYIVFLCVSVALYALLNYKKDKVFPFMLLGVFAVLAVFLVGFIVFGKSGVVEALPNLLLQLFMFALNFVIPVKSR